MSNRSGQAAFSHAAKRKKRKKMTAKERCIAAVAILAGIILVGIMLCNLPLIDYQYTNEEGQTVTTKVSVNELSDILGYGILESIFQKDKLKAQKPLVSLEGELDHNDSFEVEPDLPDAFDDGLDLDQKVEGQFTVMFLGFDELRSNSDVIMLITLDIAANEINILQIPRDSFLPNYTSFEAGKANSIYSMGDPDQEPIQRVADAFTETFGIPIDRYVTTSCTDIVEIVDLIGGVPIDMPYTIYYEPGKTIYAGQQVLSGQQAEWMVRYRHGYAEGDIGRMQAQRIFLAAAMEKACEIGTVELMSYMATVMEEQLIGSDLSIGEMTMLADFATTIGMDKVTMYMLPGEGYDYYPENWTYYDHYSVWSIHKQPTIDLINEKFRLYLTPLDYLPIEELVTEGNYVTTGYDDNNIDLETIVDGEDASPRMN